MDVTGYPAHASPPGHLARQSEALSDASGIACLVIEALLVLANIFPICVVCKLKRAADRTVTDDIIVFLSITDILSVVVPAPLWILSFFTHRWYGGPQTCNFYQLSTHWLPLASMCLVTYMCVDRFIVLYLASSFKAPGTNTLKVRAIVVLIYIFTLGLSSFPVFGLGPTSLSASGMLCENWLTARPRHTREHVFYIAFLSLGYMNLLVAIMVNVAVVVTLHRLHELFSKAVLDPSGSIHPIDRRTVTEFSIMTVVVTVVFYMTWMPALVLVTVEKSGHQVSPAAVMYALLCTNLTGLANPIIYATFSQSYRGGYKRILRAICRCVFGCPAQQEFQVLDEAASGVSERLHSTLSAANSIAALLPNRLSDSRDGNTLLLDDTGEYQAIHHSKNRLSFQPCMLESYVKVANEPPESCDENMQEVEGLDDCCLDEVNEGDSDCFLDNGGATNTFNQTHSIMQESMI